MINAPKHTLAAESQFAAAVRENGDAIQYFKDNWFETE